MTRKDYVLIAGALKRAAQYFNRAADPVAFQHGIDAAAHDIANSLAEDNPAFQRARFLAAAGVRVDG